MDVSVITIWECEVNKIQRNEEYRKKYLKILRDRIERVFNYEEEDISVQMEVAEKNKKYMK
jgi:patch repair protein